jgi:peptidoglycan L-alanyl-D-glutamate endopeptidase CwlK
VSAVLNIAEDMHGVNGWFCYYIWHGAVIMGFLFSPRSEAFLQDIDPDLCRVARRALAISRLDFAIISGKRDMAEQRRLVRSGASQTLHSRHLTGHAIDVVPLDPKTGKGRFSRALALEVAAAFYAAGQDCDVPITWGGMWSQFEDTPHFEIPIRGH